MGLTTTVHHAHAAIVLDDSDAARHVIPLELVLLPATVIAMWRVLHRDDRLALGAYAAIAALGFVGLGLREGAWNHGAKLLGALRLDTPCTELARYLPPDDPHRRFHEWTGVLTFALAMLAAYHSARFVAAQIAGGSPSANAPRRR